MAKKRHPGKQAPSKFHGDMSKRHGKAIKPQDMPVHDMKGLPTEQHTGTQLGMDPAQAAMPQTMQGPAQYPGQEIGA
jgi:hypothetical protein